LQSTEGLAGKAGDNAEELRKFYDTWSDDYDQTLRGWGYDAPQVAAARLCNLTEAGAPVLDAGCGTGLSGAALRHAGFTRITGIDFSPRSAAAAQRTRAYEQVEIMDLTRLPTSLPTGHFAGLVCIGVMSYLPDIAATCREFCRVTAPGGAIVLTQRSDLYDERGTQAAFDALAARGLWSQLVVTEPQPYLPGNPEFDGIGVHFCVFRRT
jgi:predicted TPR repeat methyltransferase